MASQSWSFAGQSYQTSYHYDSSGCLDQVIYPTGTLVTATCDVANRVTGIAVNDAALVTDISYYPAGAVATMRYANGIATTIDLDGRGRVLAITSPGVLELHYGYDGADNVTSLEDRTRPGSLRTMAYDQLNRLKISTTADGLWGYASYDYDALGNRTAKSLGSTVTYSYDSANRLERTSDAWSGPPLKLTWDDGGRLASSSDGTTYRYDGSGRRVLKAGAGQAIVYHYDTAGRLIAETLPDGTKLRDYFYLANKLVAVDGCMGDEAPPCIARQWYHTDTLGSAVVRTDEGGSVVAHVDYEPWGEQWAQTGVPGDRQYSGRVYDAGTGFHDYGARLYWPEIGRFISADTNLGSPADPRSLNRYSYVLNNPYKYVDPDGKTPLIVGALAVAGGGAVGAAIASYVNTGSVDWNYVGDWASKGFLIGLTGGLSLAASGGATATDAAVASASTAAPTVTAAEAGTAGGMVGAAQQLSSQAQRSIQSLQARLAEHIAKLDAYKANPDAYDNKGFLKNASEAVRKQIINGRVRHLENEIQNFQKQIDTLKNGGGGSGG